jgi:hypothetical protein
MRQTHQEKVDRPLAWLAYYGRRGGGEYQSQYAVEGDNVYIGTANVNRQWVRNVQKIPRISLAVGGERFEGEAHRPLIALGQILTAIGVMRDKRNVRGGVGKIE